MPCIFCKIIQKEIPCKLAYEDEEILAFHDISPQAPIHILVIPKQHCPTLNSVEKDNLGLISKMYGVVQKIVKEQKIDQSGYRCVINTNAQGGQTVFHLHLHILGGKQLGGGMVG
ncbi:MAG: histidine triad nucleotide-binding protein [Deltaproteobacteria bacterium]|nr:histidine triad nucleotide-binding protein [Deltaproteobacteria bacterium]